MTRRLIRPTSHLLAGAALATAAALAISTPARAMACFRPTRSGHWSCDLYGLARLRLADLGIASVSGGGESTFGDAGRFYSHRRDGACSGRQATLIWRQDGHDKAG